MNARNSNERELSPKLRKSTCGGGSLRTRLDPRATSYSTSVTRSVSDPYATPTGMLIRSTASESVQLISRPVTNSLLGTMSSLRSNAVIQVARIRILETVPFTSPTVTMSPTRIGRSNKMMSPETKFAKIS